MFNQHAAQLAASGITPEHADARGYRSVDTKKRLESVGVTSSGRRVPGLLVPSLRMDGSVWGYQYRPDSPRERDGRPVKYETPIGQRNGLDVPPGVGPMLGDPGIPLWVTEGVKKADAGAVAGLCIVALPGVWSWRGRNDRGGKTAVPDWHDVALDARRIILAFDSDVVRKSEVRRALDELAGYLRSKGALVEFCHLPDDEPGKTGLDDYLGAGRGTAGLLSLVRPEPPAVVDEAAPSSGLAGSAGSSGLSEGSRRTGAEPDGPLETGQLLGEVRRWLARFIITMHAADLDVLTLWAAHTHVCFETYTTPRLLLDSPVPGSGKTTVLEHLERLCHRPVQMASLSSPALLTRMLDAELRTLLIDEADRSLSPDKPDVAEFLAVLNSGYKRGGTRPVLVPSKEGGWDAKEMPTFCPVAMAGNNPSLPEDTKSRSIRVLLMPDFYGTAEESEWEQLDEEARELGKRLARWADQVRDRVRTNRPQMPETVKGRARERWSPLKRVAEAAGGRWPEAVDTLAVQDVARIEAEREEGIVTERPAVVLLRHLHEVWADGETFVRTDDLIDRLVIAYPDVWGEMSTFGKRLTPQRLGRMLVTAYNVHSDRPDSNGPRGYLAATLRPAFLRFGLALSQRPDEPAEPAEPDDDPTRCGTCRNRLHRGECVRCLTVVAS
jgi:hypothetical protein